jgi:hypothetical protein
MVTESELGLRLQGGLPPIGHIPGDALEIACDESGFSGGNMLDVATPTLTHASVDLDVGEAMEMIAELRSASPSSVHELKSGQFLRGARAGERLRWFMTRLEGRAHVHVIDKEYFLVTRIVDLFLAEPSYAAGTRLTQSLRPAALALYQAGRPRACSWKNFLVAFLELVRTKRRQEHERDRVDRFFQARDSLARDGLGEPAEGVLNALLTDRVADIVTRLKHGDRSIPPPLEPMLPALAETVLFWSSGERQVLVIHDEQSALTADRLRRLQRLLADGAPPHASAHEAGTPLSMAGPFAGLVMVDSRDDPRVQIADLLAGIARRSLENGEHGAFECLLSSSSLRGLPLVDAPDR